METHVQHCEERSIAESEPPRCPLCGSSGGAESWLGRTEWAGNNYRYLDCTGCGSLFCSPMPDKQTVELMYGPNYVRDVGDPEVETPKAHLTQVMKYLCGRPPGVLVDFGCREGNLLVAAKRAGWHTVGVELDPRVAAMTERATAIPILTPNSQELTGIADVLHIGDVIEHLTDIDRQLPDALSILKPAGILIAQGPLQNASNVFTLALRVARRLRRRVTNMAPTHVILATYDGQRALFHRMGLKEQTYIVTEEMWPAPPHLFSGFRGMSLHILRRVSQVVTVTCCPRLGNRYFYVGRYGD